MMNATDAIKLKNCFHFKNDNFEVQQVEVLGKDTTTYGRGDLIVRAADGVLFTLAEYNLYPTEETAKSALKSDIASSLKWYCDRTVKLASAATRLGVEHPETCRCADCLLRPKHPPTGDDEPDPIPPEHGGEAGGATLRPLPVSTHLTTV